MSGLDQALDLVVSSCLGLADSDDDVMLRCSAQARLDYFWPLLLSQNLKLLRFFFRADVIDQNKRRNKQF